MFSCEYPNLELIEYKFRVHLNQNDEWKEKFNSAKAKERFLRANFSVQVFKQTWGSTATAWDVMPDGSPAIAGCAMTDAYTTVIHEGVTDSYGVFIGNEPCYVVFDATEEFYADLKNQRMKSLSWAKKCY